MKPIGNYFPFQFGESPNRTTNATTLDKSAASPSPVPEGEEITNKDIEDMVRLKKEIRCVTLQINFLLQVKLQLQIQAQEVMNERIKERMPDKLGEAALFQSGTDCVFGLLLGNALTSVSFVFR